MTLISMHLRWWKHAVIFIGDRSPEWILTNRLILVQDGLGLSRTLDLASTLEGGPDGGRLNGSNGVGTNSNLRSVLTIAFQFTYEAHTRDSCAAMARQYIRTVVASVQRVAMALAPSHIPPHLGNRLPPGSPDAVVLARRILQSYRSFSISFSFLQYFCGSCYIKYLIQCGIKIGVPC